MLALRLPGTKKRLAVLCIGAHSDDIEIGCSGTLLSLIERGHSLSVTWAVLSAPGARAAEARRSAKALLRSTRSLQIILGELPDAQFPASYREARSFLSDVRDRCDPDLIFTHWLEDRHQDHRVVAELTWQLWRDHLIVEYDVPKFEGDLLCANAFVPLSVRLVQRKTAHLLRHFDSQRSKYWFSAETFQALMRLRGIACRAESGYAEGFTVRKILL